MYDHIGQCQVYIQLFSEFKRVRYLWTELKHDFDIYWRFLFYQISSVEVVTELLEFTYGCLKKYASSFRIVYSTTNAIENLNGIRVKVTNYSYFRS